MKKQILTIIFGILLISLVIAGGILTKDADISVSEKDTLNKAGLNEVSVSDLNCYDTYCTFWIKQSGFVQSERRIEKYLDVCSDTEDKEGNITRVCNRVLKLDKDLTNERDSIVNNLLKSTAKDIDDKSKSSITKLGEPVKVIIWNI